MLTAAYVTKKRLNYRKSVDASNCKTCDNYSPTIRIGRKGGGYKYASRCRLIGHAPAFDFEVLPLFICDEYTNHKLKTRLCPGSPGRMY